MLVLEGIKKKYKTVDAVRGVSLQIEDGESLVLVGESGSGKTTLAQIAVGMLNPDAGHIFLDGRELPAGYRKRSFADCVGIQYIFQDPYSALEADFTLRKTLEETNRICRRNGLEVIPAEEVIRYVDVRLLDYMERPIRELSGGQRQKVCIARTLMPSPRVIIADESASMLDKKSGDEIFDLLNRIKEEKKISLLAILHDIDFSYKKWDRIAVMWKGELVEQAGFEEFSRSPKHAYSQKLVDAYDYFNRRESI